MKDIINSNVFVIVFAFALTFILTVLILKKLIPVLKSHKMGQKILDIGPRWHKSKEDTPTMGGISFMAAVLVVSAVFILLSGNNGGIIKIAAALFLAFANGCIGIIDDRAKLKKKQNEGLKAWQKYLLQLAVTVIYLAIIKFAGFVNTCLYIPFFNTSIELGAAYYIFAIILVTGIVNSVNLTDGVDGLASSVTGIVGLFFIATALMINDRELLFTSALIVGATAGFLIYNFNPARVFMGDTGSLFLGGLTVGCAFMCSNPLLVLIAGLIYLLESISVIIQVIYYKATYGKRFFKMAPIHHHFEKCGWGEKKIVLAFSVFTLIMCAVAFISVLIKNNYYGL